MKNLLVMSAVAGLSTFGALADGVVTNFWKGGSTQFLSNPNNWPNGVVPGRVLDRSVSPVTTNGSYGGVMIFDGAKDSGWPADLRTDNNVLRLLSTGKMIFRGQELIQHMSYGYQDWRIESGGGIYVEEDVEHVPYMVANSALNFVKAPGDDLTVTLRNDSSAGPLKFLTMHESSEDWTPAEGPTLRLEGKGVVEFASYVFTPNNKNIMLVVAQEGDGKTVFSAGSSVQCGFACWKIPPSDGKRVVEFTNGAYPFCRLFGSDVRPLVVESDAEFTGTGKFGFSKFDQPAIVQIATGKMLTWGVGIENEDGRAQPFRVYGGGTLAFTAEAVNYMTGTFQIFEGSTVLTPVIAAAGALSPLGSGSAVEISEGGTLVYTGVGETSNRMIAFGTGGGVLDNRSAGVLTTGPISVAADATLVSTNGQAIVLSSLTRTVGIVNVVAANGGRVSLSGQAAGPAPQWLQFNGGIARFGADGIVMGVDGPSDYEIDAHGGRIPNDPNAKVGIVSASAEGEASITLAESPATVNILSQEQSDEPTVVMVEAGQKLAPNTINIASGAAPLVVTGSGEFGGEMLLVGGELVRSNATTGASVALTATDGPAAITLDGAASEDSPVYLMEREGRVSVRGTGAVPVRELDVSGGEVAYGKLDAYEPGVVANFDSITHQPSLALSVGTASTGVLSFDGGTFTGKVTIGQGTAGMGALYQMGGQIVNWQSYKNAEGTSATHNNPFGHGSGAYAYLGIEGGTFMQTGNAWISGNSGETVIDLLGNGRFAWARTYDRNYTAFGAWDTLLAIHVGDAAVYAGSNSSDSELIGVPYFNRENTQVEITIDGEGLMDLGNCEVNLAGHARNNTSYRHYMFNLNGGVLHARRIIRSSSETRPTEEFPEGTGGSDRANSYGFVNANGGIFKANADTALFGTRTNGSAYPIDRVTLFEKGLTIDTNGKNPEIGLGGGLRAPSGKGVVSIPWDAVADGTGFIGAPIVVIEGDGKGASARAVFDRETRTVMGIVVTSHGNDYTTANARISYGRKTVKTIPCELADNVSGGFTKIGAGTLTVNGTNTYTGATVVKEGVVKLGVDDAFASASALVLDGGMLDLDGRRQVFSDVSFANGGKVLNGTVGVLSLAVDFNDALAKKVKTVDMASVAFAPGAAVTIANFDATKLDEAVRRYVLVTFQNGVPDPALVLPVLDLPEGWSFKMSGNRLRIAKDAGLAIIVR